MTTVQGLRIAHWARIERTQQRKMRVISVPVHQPQTFLKYRNTNDAVFFPVALQPNAGHGLLILEVSRSHTTHHIRQDSSGRVISSSQRPLPDNTHCSQQTTSMPQVGIEPTISAGERPQTYALDRAGTGTGTNDVITFQNNEILKA